MTTISFTLASSQGVVNVTPQPLRANLKQLSGAKRVVTFPFGPQQLDYDGLGLEYSTVDRPGTQPLLQATMRKLREVSFDVVIADEPSGGKLTIQPILDTIEAIASENDDCLFTYGVITLPFRVRLTDFSYKALWRDLDGNIIQAECEFKFTERTLLEQSVLKLKAITYEPPRTPSTSKKKKGGSGSNTKPPSKPPTHPVPDTTWKGVDLPCRPNCGPTVQ